MSGHDVVPNLALGRIMEDASSGLHKLRVSCAIAPISLDTLVLIEVGHETLRGEDVPVVVLATGKWAIGLNNEPIGNAHANLVPNSGSIFLLGELLLGPFLFIWKRFLDRKIDAIDRDPARWIVLLLLQAHLPAFKTNLIRTKEDELR